MKVFHIPINHIDLENIKLLSNALSFKALKCITDVTFEYQITNIQVHISNWLWPLLKPKNNLIFDMGLIHKLEN